MIWRPCLRLGDVFFKRSQKTEDRRQESECGGQRAEGPTVSVFARSLRRSNPEVDVSISAKGTGLLRLSQCANEPSAVHSQIAKPDSYVSFSPVVSVFERSLRRSNPQPLRCDLLLFLFGRAALFWSWLRCDRFCFWLY